MTDTTIKPSLTIAILSCQCLVRYGVQKIGESSQSLSIVVNSVRVLQ